MNEVVFIFTIAYFCSLEVTGQYRDRYSGVNRDNDYYDRPGRDRYNTREHSQIPSIGFQSPFSDSRCLQNRDTRQVEEVHGHVQVNLRDGAVVGGTYVYLCDGPGVPELDRPGYRPNQPAKIYRNLAIFLGIPYALSPTKDRRFKPPQVKPFSPSINAIRYKNACPQAPEHHGPELKEVTVQEDCLFLNVFSPSVTSNEKYAVMIYIHGGNWDHGSGNVFPAQMLSASQEVVVVTLNYRLGPLGFFSTGEESSPGNYGLLDQAMAIEWVYDNIGSFNGDNQKITLFGPGVGAASAGIHAFSHRLGKKIHRVIAQSGSAVADWAVIKDNYTVVNNSMEFAAKGICQFKSLWRTVACLREAPLSFFETTYFKPKVGWFPWSPVVDACSREEQWRIMPDVPENMIKFHYENLHPDFSYLGGVTKDEAAYMLFKKNFERRYTITKDIFRREIEQFSSIFNYTLDVEALVKAIEFMYMPKEKDANNETLLRQGMIDVISDSYFKAPNDKIIKLLRQREIPSFMYVLNYTLEGLHSILGSFQNLYENDVPHNIEYYLATGAPFMDPKLYPSALNLEQAKWTEADRNLSHFFMTAWANFAKFGNPTPVKLFDSILWEPIDLKQMQYLSINTTNFTSTMLSGYRQKESQFWNSFLPSLLKEAHVPSVYCRPLYAPWEIQKHLYEASLWSVLGAIALSFIFCMLCVTLYCRAKSKHVVSTEDIPDTVSVTPSSIDTLLRMKRIEAGNKYYADELHGEQKHTQV